MKKIVLCLLFVAFTSINSFANDTVNLAIGEWAPYVSEKDMDGKLLEEVVTEAFKLEGIDAKYTYLPWKRSFEFTKTGKYDGTFPWNTTEDRVKEFFIHKVSLIKDDNVYFHLKSTAFDWNTLEDLKKYKVGVTLGFKQEKIYKDNGIEAEVVSSEDINFKKMFAKRVDVYETSKVIGYTTINKLFKPEEAKQFITHPKPVNTNEYYILFSRKTENGKMLSEKFDSGLNKLKESGAYDKIHIKYLGVPSS